MDKKQLKAIGHGLKPVILVGHKGVTDALLAEVDRALADHELIKAKFSSEDRDARREQMALICSRCDAELVQSIGKMALLFRKSSKPNPRTSNLIRGLSPAG
jgi:RNA-binding protein